MGLGEAGPTQECICKSVQDVIVFQGKLSDVDFSPESNEKVELDVV